MKGSILLTELTPANDNTEWNCDAEGFIFYGDDEFEPEDPALYEDNYIDISPSDAVIEFDAESAAKMGLRSTTVSLDGIIYLLGHKVAPENQKASDLMKELVARYC